MALEKWQKIFVNRSLNLGYIKAVGFDMDHTLALYNWENFENLAFSETLKKFIQNGYPEELSELRFDPTSVIRGLLVDRERGNLLKVDGHKYVKLAFHGKTQLSKEERHKLYNVESFKAESFQSVDSFFALSEVQLFTEIVDYMGRHPGKIQKSFSEVYADLRKFIDDAHRDGSIKTKVIADVGHYISKDKHMSQMLLRLIDGGKSLFLLTNSHWDYTDVVMTHILGGTHPEERDWKVYFDNIIVGAGKPGFFTGDHPFKEVDPETGALSDGAPGLDPEKIYMGGNASLFQTYTGFHGDEILYVGDHIYGDIMRSKDLFNWRTMLIVTELENELRQLENSNDLYTEILGKLKEREAHDEKLQKLRSLMRVQSRQIEAAKGRDDSKKEASLEKDRSKAKQRYAEKESELTRLEVEIKELIGKRQAMLHPVWGELMKVDLEKSRFGYQVEQYACIYTGNVSNLRYYSPAKRFVSAHELLPHDLD